MVRVGGDAVGPALVVAVVEVLQRAPEGPFELRLVLAPGAAEADNERQEVTLGVDVPGERRSASPSRSREPPARCR